MRSGFTPSSIQSRDQTRGDLLWEFKATRAIVASPAIADGVLVISDDAGNVYCLEAAKE